MEKIIINKDDKSMKASKVEEIRDKMHLHWLIDNDWLWIGNEHAPRAKAVIKLTLIIFDWLIKGIINNKSLYFVL